MKKILSLILLLIVTSTFFAEWIVYRANTELENVVILKNIAVAVKYETLFKPTLLLAVTLNEENKIKDITVLVFWKGTSLRMYNETQAFYTIGSTAISGRTYSIAKVYCKYKFDAQKTISAEWYAIDESTIVYPNLFLTNTKKSFVMNLFKSKKLVISASGYEATFNLVGLENAIRSVNLSKNDFEKWIDDYTLSLGILYGFLFILLGISFIYLMSY
ncbi:MULTISPECIES: hypothetical protein [unclassified Thermosipho (in: thermotogales)]|uniref:hypothetical protein n=1 Tax=unclassified Thermosipho (in: thermotogales) TaxID=2676525 RepID=UPI000984C52A|nr:MULTISPECIES: hypothetical protein [unclassified Thermosipho (in: thermotogales)]MBT1247339.1 hypothetical protein [Thermosipho sp. 1244]OOC46939.1 hypothetical protein XO09_04065 [Thermosipho sp. 1223]